ncbi:MAG: BMP family ABC transporter substrate-binding protein [Lachnospiraceae bacterium]
MKKRLLSVLLSALLLTTALAGCASSADSTTTDETTAAETQTEEIAGIDKDDVIIGVIHLTDTSDQGYVFNHNVGVEKMIENLGLREDQVITKFNVAEGTETDTALRELIESGANIIFGTNFGFENYMLELAKEYPDVQFCHATGYQAASSGLSNLHNYFPAISEAIYLTGVVAGLKTENNKLGYVAGQPYAEVISGFTAFYLGAKSVNPDVTMEVKYVNSFADPQADAQAAQALIDSGCDVLSNYTGSTTTATVAEKNNVWHVGYNTDMIEAAPNANIISAAIDWSQYMTIAVQAVIDGTQIPADWSEGLSADGTTDAVYVTQLNEAIAPEGAQEALDQATEALRSGETHVFQGPLKGVNADGEEIDLKEGEYFTEQEVISAPSWNYIVDGVTVDE